MAAGNSYTLFWCDNSLDVHFMVIILQLNYILKIPLIRYFIEISTACNIVSCLQNSYLIFLKECNKLCIKKNHLFCLF